MPSWSRRADGVHDVDETAPTARGSAVDGESGQGGVRPADAGYADPRRSGRASPASTSLGRYGRQLGILPREAYQAQAAARAEQTSDGWQARYARRAGVEGSIHQAVAITGTRHARYRGITKTHLEYAFTAVALN